MRVIEVYMVSQPWLGADVCLGRPLGWIRLQLAAQWSVFLSALCFLPSSLNEQCFVLCRTPVKLAIIMLLLKLSVDNQDRLRRPSTLSAACPKLSHALSPESILISSTASPRWLPAAFAPCRVEAAPPEKDSGWLLLEELNLKIRMA